MFASLGKLMALPDPTLVYCAHEYTAANGAFALTVEPDNGDLRARMADVLAAREAGRPTVPSTIGLERLTNPFLRAGDPALRAAAQAHAGRALDDDVAVFAALRAWKNAFR